MTRLLVAFLLMCAALARKRRLAATRRRSAQPSPRKPRHGTGRYSHLHASLRGRTETTFIGMTVRKGYGPILERFQKAYTTPEQMGTLSFINLEVRLLPSSCGKVDFAAVTGGFHLERIAQRRSKKR